MIPRSSKSTAYPRMDEMLWFGGRCSWFPGARIGEHSEVEWRDNKVYPLETDGSAVEGIRFAGEIATD